MNQFDRVFALHRLLDGRRTPLPLAAIEHALECSPATAKRTVRHLREILGAPLDFDRHASGYRYRPGERFELPGLWFTPGELAALLTLEHFLESESSGLLAETLRSFRSRIEALMAREGVGVPDWRKRLRLLRMHARSSGGSFSIVTEALTRRRQLSFDYRNRGDDQAAARTVSPQRLTLYRDNWYLDAWCHKRGAPRMFSLERISTSRMLEHTASEIPVEEVDEALSPAYGLFSGTPSAIAELRFTPFAARWVAEEVWHPQQKDEPQPDGSLLRRIPFHRDEELLMDILRHGAEVEVVSPPALRKRIEERLRAALERYRE